ncbi:MAG: EAL domain-containing protein [Janthinobacterium lividum]
MGHLDDSGDVSEVEALVRWERPERGLIEPGKFIPLAEETGLLLCFYKASACCPD